MHNPDLFEQDVVLQPRHPDRLSESPARPWYVGFTKPRQEQYAEGKLQEQGYEVYLPMLESWARQTGQWGKKRTVMFPRYAFVRPGQPSQGVGPITSTPGVTSLVRFGAVPATLADDRLQALRRLALARSGAMPQEPLNIGQQVVFCSGPLKGANGIVSSVAAERVNVMMSLLGQSHTVLTSSRDLALA